MPIPIVKSSFKPNARYTRSQQSKILYTPVIPTSYYTTNYVSNPSFQGGFAGYSVIQDINSNNTATMYLDDTDILYGVQSLFVLTNGIEAGEGVNLYQVTAYKAAMYSASCYIKGNGTVLASLIINGVATTFISVMVTDQWQRIAFNGFSLNNGDVVYISLTTSTTSAIQFRVSGVQTENSVIAHPYCDGDQPGCFWTLGYPSPSYQPVANPISATMAITTSTYGLNILVKGAQFASIPGTLASHDYFPVIYVGSAGPAGAVTDFSVSLLTDQDPAQTYGSWNNYTASVTNTGYTRVFATFIPPADYIVSNGQYLYHRASYAVPGWLFPSYPNAAAATITKVQVEDVPITNLYGALSPTTFDTPRAVHSIVEPNRLNFCPNPSMESNTTSWSAVGTASLSQDTAIYVGQFGAYDDMPYGSGTKSLKITVNANSDGTLINIPGLLTGFTYTASAYVLADIGLANVLMSIGNGTTSILASSGTGYDTGLYGAGGYGGVTTTGGDVTTNIWYRLSVTFQATAGTNALEFFASAGSDVVYPTHFWVDAVLIEAGSTLGPYFDGNSTGDSYLWAGTTNNSASYYYVTKGAGTQAVADTLTKHVPLGISAVPPLYLTAPIG